MVKRYLCGGENNWKHEILWAPIPRKAADTEYLFLIYYTVQHVQYTELICSWHKYNKEVQRVKTGEFKRAGLL